MKYKKHLSPYECLNAAREVIYTELSVRNVIAYIDSHPGQVAFVREQGRTKLPDTFPVAFWLFFARASCKFFDRKSSKYLDKLIQDEHAQESELLEICNDLGSQLNVK